MKKVFVCGLLTILMISLVVMPAMSSSISETENIDERPKRTTTITIFCEVNIQSEEGTGTLEQAAFFLMWTSQGRVSITGLGQDYISEEPSGGFLIFFRGTATEDPFIIQGRALISYAAPIEE